MLAWVLQDYSANSGARDSQFVVVSYRFAQWALTRWGPLGRLVSGPYRFSTSLLVGVEIPLRCTIGPNLQIHHPHSIVLSEQVVLGAGCILRQNVTIGTIRHRDGSQSAAPVVGNGVEFGAGCVVVGAITVADSARIAALALVRDDVPAHGVAVGNPASVVRISVPPAGERQRQPQP